MPPSTKCRQVCAEYLHKVFTPKDCKQGSQGSVTVTVDELEAMRLCDLEGLDQEQCALRMDISRGTYQRILYAGRKKTVEALTQGKEIRIDGGNYKVATKNCTFHKKCQNCYWESVKSDSKAPEDAT